MNPLDTRIVFSAAYGEFRNYLAEANVRNIMMSYFYESASMKSIRTLYSQMENPPSLWFDSGCFTLWNAPEAATPRILERVNREKYAEFALRFHKEFQDVFPRIFYVSWDVIPGEIGRPVTQRDVDESVVKSWDNFVWLREQGVPNLLPVVHQHEPPELINEYEALLGEDAYICVSPANNAGPGARRRWLDQVFALKSPSTRTHGLAVTGEAELKRYRWYSVDSKTWLMGVTHSYGNVMNFGKPVWLGNQKEMQKMKHVQRLKLSRLMLCAADKRKSALRSIRYHHDLERQVNVHWMRKELEVVV